MAAASRRRRISTCVSVNDLQREDDSLGPSELHKCRRQLPDGPTHANVVGNGLAALRASGTQSRQRAVVVVNAVITSRSELSGENGSRRTAARVRGAEVLPARKRSHQSVGVSFDVCRDRSRAVKSKVLPPTASAFCERRPLARRRRGCGGGTGDARNPEGEISRNNAVSCTIQLST